MNDEDLQSKFLFPKHKRIVNHELMAIVRSLPCMACGTKPSDAHHITTRGAGGDDVPENLMPLCSHHHREWHQMGPNFMIKTYSCVKHWLVGAGRTDILDGGKFKKNSGEKLG